MSNYFLRRGPSSLPHSCKRMQASDCRCRSPIYWWILPGLQPPLCFGLRSHLRIHRWDHKVVILDLERLPKLMGGTGLLCPIRSKSKVVSFLVHNKVASCKAFRPRMGDKIQQQLLPPSVPRSWVWSILEDLCATIGSRFTANGFQGFSNPSHAGSIAASSSSWLQQSVLWWPSPLQYMQDQYCRTVGFAVS